jgi:predicted  nucleic acid-binding Zn-ribbon protein
MKDIKSSLLVLLSVGLVGTWVYHLYDKTLYSQRRTEVYIKDSTAVAQGIQDSLQKLYVTTITDLDIQLDSTRSNADSLQSQLGVRLQEIYTLKSEIDKILKNRGASKADLGIARIKIAELQQKVDALSGEKESMESEKNRLNDIMAQLSGQFTALQKDMERLGTENKMLAEKVNLASVFVASEIRLMPMTVKNDKETETSVAKKTTKFVVSFAVQNNINEYKIAEVYAIVTLPNGKILKNDDVWEASALMALANGTKTGFTRKVRFEYEKGESRKLIFSLDAEDFPKGNYSLEIFHNGYMIGQTTKTLN